MQLRVRPGIHWQFPCLMILPSLWTSLLLLQRTLTFRMYRITLLKACLQWTEEGQHCSLYVQHYRLYHADHSSTPHNQWGIRNRTESTSVPKQLRMTLADGSSVPVYGTTGSYMIHESGATSRWTEGSFSRARDVSGAPIDKIRGATKQLSECNTTNLYNSISFSKVAQLPAVAKSINFLGRGQK